MWYSVYGTCTARNPQFDIGIGIEGIDAICIKGID